MTIIRLSLSGLICSVLALSWSLPVSAANWVHISTDGDGDSYYQDATSARRSGNYVTIWEKTVFQKVKSDGEAYSVSQYRYDCANETQTLLHLVSYDSDGKVLGTFSWKGVEQTANAVVPDTIGRQAFEAICVSSSHPPKR